jgi:hypothetical protein
MAALIVLGVLGAFLTAKRRGDGMQYVMSHRRREADFRRPPNEGDLL